MSDFSTILAVAGCGYLALAALVVRRAPQATFRGIAESPNLTILKPLYGAEAGLLDRLLSFCDQQYDGEVQIVFGCHNHFDAAIPIVQQVALMRPDRDVSLIVDERLLGSNRKVSNLLHCLEKARHEVIVLADSDIAVDPSYLVRVVEALSRPGVGAVTCLYDGDGEVLGATLSAIAINAHFLPNVLVGMSLGAAKPCFGSTIALRRETLERIGGLRKVIDKLADDYALGAAVRAIGLDIAVPGFTVRHACSESTIGAFFAHQLRVARTIRCIEPRGHVGSLVANPLPIAVIAAVGSLHVGLCLVAAAIAFRLMLVREVEKRFNTVRHPRLLLPVCDLAMFVVFIASFCGSTLEWRGHRFRSASGGLIVPRRT